MAPRRDDGDPEADVAQPARPSTVTATPARPRSTRNRRRVIGNAAAIAGWYDATAGHGCARRPAASSPASRPVVT